jgi:DNA ligase-associated metallophosphoesterase
MKPPFPFRLKGQQLWLSAERCIFWEEERSLIVSDLHFGKTGHFRKWGIAVPQAVYREDLQRLLAQIQYFQPREILIVGDLFHSRENKELELFLKWRDDLSGLEFRLVKGNHDILHEDWYATAGIVVCPEKWQVGDFSFIHDIATAGDRAGYAFSGHIHPGIRINGPGRQSLQFPCFYFGANHAVIPAFSRFTGMVSIEPERDSAVFAIVPSESGGVRKGGYALMRC